MRPKNERLRIKIFFFLFRSKGRRTSFRFVVSRNDENASCETSNIVDDRYIKLIKHKT